MTKTATAIIFAILAAALYAVNVPLSKLLLDELPPAMLAGLLYVGAGVGIGGVMAVKRALRVKSDTPYLERSDMPYTVAMVLLDIAAPILLMLGVKYTAPANVSLLGNFEIVATSVIAYAVFREKVSRRLFFAILLVILGSGILVFEGSESLDFSVGSIFVLGACLCWGVENNCTRKLSEKSSEQIVLVKGIFSGFGSIAAALLVGERLTTSVWMVLAALGVGFLSYGLSIDFYIKSQKTIGAAKTSAFYSIAPFLGVGFGIALCGDKPSLRFFVALAVMVVSTVVMVRDTLADGGD